MKAQVGKEKALVGAFSVVTNLRGPLFAALESREVLPAAAAGPGPGPGGAQGAAGHGGQEQEGGAADREEDRDPQPRHRAASRQ